VAARNLERRVSKLEQPERRWEPVPPDELRKILAALAEQDGALGLAAGVPTARLEARRDKARGD
jgi:hypothetical protein